MREDEVITDPLAELRRRYPWPEERPSVPPIDWALEGGGKQLVVEMIEKHDVRLILEIGSFLGGSVKQWLASQPDLVVLCLDPWISGWSKLARQEGRTGAEATQLERHDGCYRTFLANFWDQRERVIPIRGVAPDKLYELHELGVKPDLVYIDNDKSGRELSACEQLFPGIIICGDDWLWGRAMGYPIRQPVQEFCKEHGRYLKISRHTWVIHTQRPPIEYYKERGREKYRRLRRRVKKAARSAGLGRST